jgi:RND family efflux transporter MFP subunit
LAAALLLAACSAETAPAPRAERPVQVQSVAYQAEDAARDFVGVVRARYETDLGFRVGGKMVARLVNMGDRVHAGEVVARLDPEDLRLQVESAEAELAAATTNLNQTSADFERYETLKARGYASIADFDRKTAAKGEAESRLARAKRSLDLARNQLDYAELKAGADGASRRRSPAEAVVSLGQRSCPSRRKGSCRRAAGKLAHQGTRGGPKRHALVR